jgi:DNA-binding MarR family transcriptional regulator
MTVPPPGTTSIKDLDPVIHAPKRLAAMAVLANSESTDFPFLREHLGISDSDLSKQMAALEVAGYVSISKTGRGRGATTTYRITGPGRAAYERHRAALRALLDS